MKLRPQPALVALTSMIVIGALTVLIVVFIVLAGIDLVLLGYYDTESSRAFAGADGCMEEALLEVAESGSYTGENITIGSVDCVITVSGVGDNKTISVTASQGTDFSSDIEADVDRSTNPITVDDWDRVVN